MLHPKHVQISALSIKRRIVISFNQRYVSDNLIEMDLPKIILATFNYYYGFAKKFLSSIINGIVSRTIV